ncbi:hypothetical protein EYF80_060848 [Liparis tanakae]|uniref:Uncharacterized protein n=1 Tax=Liparis tanakae TaxID=230148 RepID=A0A4Z2EKM4_9TELE|nr:hypothetical protein EYF80_060848 [Liparis tanakae]
MRSGPVLSSTSCSWNGEECSSRGSDRRPPGAALSLADDELAQVGLREAAQLLQRVVLGHRQAADVRRQAGERHGERVGGAELQPQHHAQDVGHALRHL